MEATKLSLRLKVNRFLHLLLSLKSRNRQSVQYCAYSVQIDKMVIRVFACSRIKGK